MQQTRLRLALLLIAGLAVGGGLMFWSSTVGFTGEPRGEVIDAHDRIAFISTRDGQRDLYTIKADGSDLRRLTEDEADDQGPSWSSDGRQIVFASLRGDASQLFKIANGGGAPIQITTDSGGKESPLWSPSAQTNRIAYLYRGFVNLVAPGGQDVRQVMPAFTQRSAVDRLLFRNVRWSPDGRSLLATQVGEDREELSLRFDLSTGQPMTALPALQVVADWAPGGDQVVVAVVGATPPGEEVEPGQTPQNLQNVIAVFEVARSGAEGARLGAMTRMLLQSPTAEGVAPVDVAWSPDGATLVIQAERAVPGTGGADRRPDGLYLLSARGDGEPPRQIVEGAARQPRWSPDGSRLLFLKERQDGRRDLWIADADGANARSLTDGRGDNYDAAWSPVKGSAR